LTSEVTGDEELLTTGKDKKRKEQTESDDHEARITGSAAEVDTGSSATSSFNIVDVRHVGRHCRETEILKHGTREMADILAKYPVELIPPGEQEPSRMIGTPAHEFR
jgi:hypothetical protein